MVDSIYLFNWDNTSSAWSLEQKRYYTNDCNLKQPLEIVSQRRGWQVDTFHNDYKLFNGYYPSGTNRIFDVHHWDDDPGIWVKLRHDTLDDLGRWLTITGSTYDDESNAITNGTMDATSYNAAGGQLKYVKWHLDMTTGLYFYQDSTAWNYNPANQLLEEMRMKFDTISQTWTPVSKNTSTYDNDGKQLTREYFNYSNNEWRPTNRFEYLYDPQGALMTLVGEQYDPTTQQFNEYNQVLYTYNANGQLQQRLIQYFNNGSYTDYQRVEYAYFPDGTQSSETTYRWVAPWQAWHVFILDSTNVQGKQALKMSINYNVSGNNVSTNGSRQTYHYNADGLLDLETYEDLTANTLDEWVVNNRKTYTYEDTDLLQEYLVEVWQPWNGQYINSNKMVYFNGPCIPSATSSLAEPTTTCYYANPLQLGQPITCPDLPTGSRYRLELFNLSGGLAHSQAFQSGDALLPAAKLAPGFYFLTIHSETGLAYRAKVLVAR